MSILGWALIGIVIVASVALVEFLAWRADKDHLNEGYFGEKDDTD